MRDSPVRWVLITSIMMLGCAQRMPLLDDEGQAGTRSEGCVQGATQCSAGMFQVCEEGRFRTRAACLGSKRCHDKLGCVDCLGPVCMGDKIHACQPDGTVGPVAKTCAPGTCRDGICDDGCSGNGADLIYVVDERYRLLSFNPRDDKNEFKLIGSLDCPASRTLPGHGGLGAATPFSMSVDRDARAWVLYTSGEMFLVSTRDASCQKTTFRVGQEGFELFGMGFVTDARGADTEKLYISGGQASMVQNGSLGRIDVSMPANLIVEKIGPLSRNQYGPELTGTGNAELWAYFPGELRTVVARIDKATGRNEQEFRLAGLGGAARAWAFAHWGGRFYIFITVQDDLGNLTSQVQRFDPGDGMKHVILPDIPYMIVGAGVSTCAPVIIG